MEEKNLGSTEASSIEHHCQIKIHINFLHLFLYVFEETRKMNTVIGGIHT